MKKEELIALGIPEDRVKEASRIWHEELRKLVSVAAEKDSKTAAMLRDAISCLLPTIKSISSLRRVLRAASTAYYKEDLARSRKRDEEAKKPEEGARE